MQHALLLCCCSGVVFDTVSALTTSTIHILVIMWHPSLRNGCFHLFFIFNSSRGAVVPQLIQQQSHQPIIPVLRTRHQPLYYCSTEEQVCAVLTQEQLTPIPSRPQLVSLRDSALNATPGSLSCCMYRPVSSAVKLTF